MCEFVEGERGERGEEEERKKERKKRRRKKKNVKEEVEKEDKGRSRKRGQRKKKNFRLNAAKAAFFFSFTSNMFHDDCLGTTVECILSMAVLTVVVSQAETNWSAWERYTFTSTITSRTTFETTTIIGLTISTSEITRMFILLILIYLFIYLFSILPYCENNKYSISSTEYDSVLELTKTIKDHTHLKTFKNGFNEI